MNYRQFAKEYLDDIGAYDKDTMYGGMLGEAVMKLVETMEGEGHSGNSFAMTVMIFNGLNMAYENPEHKIWQKYWESDEGKKLKESIK